MINTRSQKILLTPAFPVPEGWQTRLSTRSRAGLNRPEIQTSPTTRWPPNRIDFSPTDWRRKKRAYQNGLARVPKAGNCRHSDFRTRRDLPNLHRNKTSQTSRHSSKFAISILTAASPCQSLATTCRGEQRVFSDPTCSQTRRALEARRRKPSPNPSRLAIDGHLAALRHRPSGVSAVSPLSTCQSRSIKNTQTVPAAHHGLRKPVCRIRRFEGLVSQNRASGRRISASPLRAPGTPASGSRGSLNRTQAANVHLCAVAAARFYGASNNRPRRPPCSDPRGRSTFGFVTQPCRTSCRRPSDPQRAGSRGLHRL
jgi:hypothetical protein